MVCLNINTEVSSSSMGSPVTINIYIYSGKKMYLFVWRAGVDCIMVISISSYGYCAMIPAYWLGCTIVKATLPWI